MQVEPNKFDDAFIHQAWEQMSHILDKEMPVKKRRPFLWIWFLLGVVSLAGAGFMYRMNIYLKQQPVKTEVPTSLVPIEQAQLPIVEQNNNKSIIENNEENI
ncbi:MAG: hypothetical protein HC912_02440 [Saprospiraceae bacterium]|nr:hypothetical protein [Saprospiraceae bacterium]